MPESAGRESLAALPDGARWQALYARERPRAASVRSTALTNPRQTLAVLGFLPDAASRFEQLRLAGRMLKATAERAPQTVGLVALGPSEPAAAALEALLAATLAEGFALPSFKSAAGAPPTLRRIVLPREPRIDTRYATVSAAGTNLARWLTALPPNLLDSSGFHSVLRRLAHRHGLRMSWLGEPALRRLGANAFLAVAAGNAQPAAGIARLSYRPARRRRGAPDLALIGKGIVFDTGGVNLKSHRSMLEMHTDMSGSAVALATLIALAELRAPIAADAWLAISENSIGPRAYRPQEVVRAANGVTIQVVHTDAEGRMALADTLALAARTRPRLMLDFATLTGACVHALTERMSGVFTNRPALDERLLAAGRASGERVWPFPCDADFDTDLESKVADVMQCAVEGKGDHILAARFLGRFVPREIPWAHVDLSAATRTGGLGHVNTEITGFGVRLALELLLRQNVWDALEKRS
ncbi:MAG: M17 family metallopeptidase [Steroidobacteraceae bacterium]